MKIVTKPWGHEKWLHTDKYVLKEIFIKAGFRTSIQYHKAKEETNYILKGKGILYCYSQNMNERYLRQMSAGDVFDIMPPKIHRIEATTNLTIIEASTPEVDDIIRLADDTNRPDGRIESEHK